MKQIRLVFKSGAVVVVPYSSKFYTALTENMGKDVKVEHPSATVNTKDLQAAIYEVVEAE